MDPNQSNVGGPKGGRKNKKKKNKSGQENDPSYQQEKSVNIEQQKKNPDNNDQQKSQHQQNLDINNQQEQLQNVGNNSDQQQKIHGPSPTGNPQVEQQIQLLRNSLTIPKRKNQKIGGTMGRATEIEVNYLPLNLDKLFKKTVYHIHVDFEPDLPKRLLRLALEEFNRNNYPNINIAFDGRKNMYSTKELKGKSGTVSILNDENNKLMDFNIVTSVVNVIAMNKIEFFLKDGSSTNPPGDAFQALDIVLKNRPFALRFTNIGRSFFPIPRITPIDLGEGMEVWKGFFQSPVMGWKPYLNIDVAYKAFPKHQKLISYIENDLNCKLTEEMDKRSSKTLLDYIKGLKVDFIIPQNPTSKRVYNVVGLLESANNFIFKMDNKKQLNVVEYFKNFKNYNIKYPNLPCLHVGNVNKKTAIPIELCTLKQGQQKMKKLSENQTVVMVKNATRLPAERRQNIENFRKTINYNQDPVLKEFGIDIMQQFATVPARVLDQPFLAYAQNKEIKPTFGVWKPDKFIKGIQLKRWIIINMDQRTNIQKLKIFEKCLMDSGKDLNVAVSPMDPVLSYFIQKNVFLSKLYDDITTIFNQQKNTIELFVVIIPDFPGIYATIKRASELQVGVLTQCIKAKTVFNMNMFTATNILMKINSKLNGINHTLAVKSSPQCMKGAIIFGADVSHPSPDQSDIPSIAAVAASHDLYGCLYNMEWRLQDPKVEIIYDLEDIIYKQLLKFKECTKTIPKKIFYFRDGVSEGMFLQLLENELISIRRACLRLHINYKPTVTFLVVQKRHHTRMFPKHSNDMNGTYSNVCSGTIIDTQITHPTEMDFYLCSHASIQGTSRPTKYHLIWDDSNINENELEKLTFFLCFMFVRCTRSVSYPAPTYYAHLAAFRVRSYIENKSININHLNEEQKNMVENAFNEFNGKTPMFFV